MVYATYSTGFRPGGVNRVYDAAIKAIFPPYQADYLKNYELGWKTQWLNHHLRWNGALFVEDWDNFQLAYLGPNSVTVVQNAASARIKGVETNLEWAAGGGWLLSASATYLDAKLTSNFCGTYLPGTTTPLTNCPNQIIGGPNNQLPFQFADGTVTTGPLALSGARLPVVPEFKGNVLARYNFAVADLQANVQDAYGYQTSSRRSRVPSAFSSDRGSREVGARGSAGAKSFGSGRRSRTENSTLFFARTKSRPHDLLQVPFIANPALN